LSSAEQTRDSADALIHGAAKSPIVVLPILQDVVKRLAIVAEDKRNDPFRRNNRFKPSVRAFSCAQQIRS